MAGVFRRQMPAMSLEMIPAYLFHGVTAILGMVFSHSEGFTRLSQLWGPIVSHVVTTGLGMFCLGKAGMGQQAM